MLAGAGTGKTAALTARLAHLIASRRAWRFMARRARQAEFEAAPLKARSDPDCPILHAEAKPDFAATANLAHRAFHHRPGGGGTAATAFDINGPGLIHPVSRSEERCVGKAVGSTCRTRWAAEP